MKHIILLISLLLPLSLWAQKERKYIREGNKHYQNQNFSDAETAYLKAQNEAPSSFEANFNLGTALYKQKRYKEAAEKFQSLAGNPKVSKEKMAKVYHNLGNSLLEGKKYKESIQAYKNALRHNPADNQTRYNLAYAQKMLRKQQQQQQQQQNQQNQDKNQQNQEQNENQQNQDQKQENQDQNQDQDQQNQQNQDKENSDEQDQQRQQRQQQQISKQDAERILKALENDEKQLQEKIKKRKAKAKKVKTEKDW